MYGAMGTQANGFVRNFHFGVRMAPLMVVSSDQDEGWLGVAMQVAERRWFANRSRCDDQMFQY